MAESENHIRARFVIHKGTVTIQARYHEVAVVIRWPRTDDPDLTSRRIRTMLANLPDVVRDGLNEAYVQDETNHLDDELRDFFKEEG